MIRLEINAKLAQSLVGRKTVAIRSHVPGMSVLVYVGRVTLISEEYVGVRYEAEDRTLYVGQRSILSVDDVVSPL